LYDISRVNARFFEPMLCLAVSKLPDGAEWQLELKLDGYRGIGIKSKGRAHLASRNGKNFSERFPTITRALDRLPDETVIDGEIVAVDETGRPSFNLLQNFGGAEHTIVFYAFDLLILAGTDLRSRPLEQRRALLRELMPTLAEPIRHSETFDVPAEELLATVLHHGLEGVVAKRRTSSYRPGDRSGDWVKLRANRGQELVIGGYVPSVDTFDSILVGYYKGSDLTYAARIRNGFVPALRQKVFAQFRSLAIAECPFVNLPERGKGRWGEGLTAEDMEHCRWLKPRLVASIEFLEWTPENRLRHPKFVGLRDDQEAEQVVRED
jgi:DNA ligase D-like protein (predicted ligase)